PPDPQTDRRIRLGGRQHQRVLRGRPRSRLTLGAASDGSPLPRVAPCIEPEPVHPGNDGSHVAAELGGQFREGAGRLQDPAVFRLGPTPSRHWGGSVLEVAMRPGRGGAPPARSRSIASAPCPPTSPRTLPSLSSA